MNGTGCLEDTFDARDAEYPVSAVLDGFGIPDSLEYSRFVDKVRDQGKTSACVGFALTRSIHIRAQLQGVNVEHGSPLYAYTMGRAVLTKSPVEELHDLGSYPREVVRAVRDHGVCVESAWPFDVSKVNQRPAWGALERAIDHKVDKFHWVLSDGEDRVIEMRRALACGYPLCVRMRVDPVFRKWNVAGTMPALTPDKIGGLDYHYVAVIGYRPDAFLIVNSWGIGWGDCGYAWIPNSRITDPSTGSILAVEVAPF